MTTFYADTSAVVGAYLPGEPGHAEIRDLLLQSESRVLTSELTRVEFASATAAAMRGRRLEDARLLVARFDADNGPGRPFKVLSFDGGTVLRTAHGLVLEHVGLRTLDALHLAIAISDARRLVDDGPVFVTRDNRQAEAAKAHGFELA
ncbi:type II toxin-antitoxin system VapC family toxin [Prauserella alba]|uniref:Ribonuclease VapC n=1 Tax=Prauserella alba TaxID=176898 RepID=A0ABN1VL63_9PSEU|nr:type II toxin-antitoxin system VapC family toxin [Prauserella alba]MCP2181037.1 putative nucleic acid-binding protein, contains PIN domain [Prauserella alba]